MRDRNGRWHSHLGERLSIAAGKKLYVNCLIKKIEGTTWCNIDDEILFNPVPHYDSNWREYYQGIDRIGYDAINNGNNNSLITARRTLNSNDAVRVIARTIIAS